MPKGFPTPPERRRDIEDAIRAGMKGSDIREMLSTSSGTLTLIKREMGIPIRSRGAKGVGRPIRTQDVAPEPTAALSPAAYVEAFEARVLEYHGLLKQKDMEIDRLNKENNQLRADYQQVIFQVAQQPHWTGPTSLIGKSLGNGG